mgnify:FL=1
MIGVRGRSKRRVPSFPEFLESTKEFPGSVGLGFEKLEKRHGGKDKRLDPIGWSGKTFVPEHSNSNKYNLDWSIHQANLS